MKYFLIVLLFISSIATGEYNRDDWGDWSKSCFSTRDIVLLRDSEKKVHIVNCKVEHGWWVSPYDQKIFIYPAGIDIDHIVPLKYAHDHGAANWSVDKKLKFANDLDNLLSTSASSNRSKGEKSPFRWMPPNKQYWCTYLNKWNFIIHKYGLKQDPLESAYISNQLKGCK